MLTTQVLALDDGRLHLLPGHHGAGEGQLQERAELAEGLLLVELPHVDQLPDLLLRERGVALNEMLRSQINTVSARNAVHKPARYVVFNIHGNFMQPENTCPYTV